MKTIDDLMEQIDVQVKKGDRVLVTTADILLVVE